MDPSGYILEKRQNTTLKTLLMFTAVRFAAKIRKQLQGPLAGLREDVVHLFTMDTFPFLILLSAVIADEPSRMYPSVPCHALYGKRVLAG